MLNKLQVDAKFMLKIYILHIMTLKSVENLKKQHVMQPPPHLNHALSSMTSNTLQQRGVRVKIQHDNNTIQPPTMKLNIYPENSAWFSNVTEPSHHASQETNLMKEFQHIQEALFTNTRHKKNYQLT